MSNKLFSLISWHNIKHNLDIDADANYKSTAKILKKCGVKNHPIEKLRKSSIIDSFGVINYKFESVTSQSVLSKLRCKDVRINHISFVKSMMFKNGRAIFTISDKINQQIYFKEICKVFGYSNCYEGNGYIVAINGDIK